MRKYEKLTQEHKDKIVELYQQGVSLNGIAKELSIIRDKVTYTTTVRDYLSKMGLLNLQTRKRLPEAAYITIEEMYEKGEKIADIAVHITKEFEVNCNWERVRKYLVRRGLYIKKNNYPDTISRTFNSKGERLEKFVGVYVNDVQVDEHIRDFVKCYNNYLIKYLGMHTRINQLKNKYAIIFWNYGYKLVKDSNNEFKAIKVDRQ